MNDPQDAWLASVLLSRAEHSHSPGNCPHPERIWDAVRLQVPLDERLQIIDHLWECPTCAEAWRLAAELPATHEDPVQPHVRAFPLRREVSLPWHPLRALYAGHALSISTAALLLVVFSIGFIVFRPVQPVEDVALHEAEPRDVPLAQRQQAVRATGAFVVPVGPSHPQGGVWFSWTPGPANSKYDVIVTTPDGKFVAAAHDVGGTEVTMPAQSLAGALNRGALQWRVETHMPDGSTVSSSLFPLPLGAVQRTSTNQAPRPPAGESQSPTRTDEAAIRAVIGTFARAIETKDLELYKSVRPRLSSADESVLRETFNLPDVQQQVVIRVDNIRVEGRTATVQLTREDVITTGGRERISYGTSTMHFEKIEAAGWIIAD